ncbi:MAG: hypothetical protein LBD42_05470 [Desulfovibrio sp.]|jgi:hypothetical protein|nr:hypothetical protein [Desulfovibrio sp.]
MISHLSVSQLGTFQPCAEQWRRRYIIPLAFPQKIHGHFSRKSLTFAWHIKYHYFDQFDDI